MAENDQIDRRRFLTAVGGSAAAVTLAGCLGDGDDGDDGGSDGSDGDDGGSDGSDGDDGGSDGGDGDDGGDGEESLLVYGRGSDSSTLDPHATSSGEDAKVTNQVYDKLVHFEPGESTLTEGLASDFTLEETTASLTLREDATWHNGDDVTAEDFVATFRRFVDEEYEYFVGDSQSFYGPYLYGPVGQTEDGGVNIDAVEAVGDYELEISLSSRYAPFLRSLAVFAMAVLPKSLIEEGHNFAEEPVGSGAFQFDEWDTGNQRIRLSPNEEYWGQVPAVDELVFEGIGENSTRAQSLDAGELDIIDGVGAAQSDVIDNSDAASLERTSGMTVGYMAFNMAQVEEFRDKRVRQAISHAINTQAIVENIYRGLAIQASHPLPPTVMGHNEDLSPYEYDPEKAQSLLEEAGATDLSFTLSTMTNPRPYFASPVQTAETVRSNLSEVGIEVEIDEQSSWDGYLEFTANGEHDACFLGWISDNADPDNFYSPLLHPGIDVEDVPEGQDWVSFDTEGYNTGSRSGWANRDFMEMVDEGKKTYDEGEREEMYLEVAEIAHDEAPWVYMTHTEELRGVHNRVSGFTMAAIGGPFLNLVDVE